MEGWVDLAYPAKERPGVELAISWSQVGRRNHYTPSRPSHNSDADSASKDRDAKNCSRWCWVEWSECSLSHEQLPTHDATCGSVHSHQIPHLHCCHHTYPHCKRLDTNDTIILRSQQQQHQHSYNNNQTLFSGHRNTLITLYKVGLTCSKLSP